MLELEREPVFRGADMHDLTLAQTRERTMQKVIKYLRVLGVLMIELFPISVSFDAVFATIRSVERQITLETSPWMF